MTKPLRQKPDFLLMAATSEQAQLFEKMVKRSSKMLKKRMEQTNGQETAHEDEYEEVS